VISNWLPPSSPVYVWSTAQDAFVWAHNISTSGDVQQFTPFYFQDKQFLACSLAEPLTYSTIYVLE
jgi:hypothetical protein